MIEVSSSATVVDARGRMSAPELVAERDRLSVGLRDRGVREGDRVVVLGRKSREFVAALLAVSQTGAVAVAPYLGWTAAHLRHIIEDSRPSLILALEDAPASVRLALDAMAPCVMYTDLRARSGTAKPFRAERRDPGAPAMLIYTSGSTGMPKGVVFSYENLELGADSVAAYFGLNDTDRVLCLLPFSFDAGLNQLLSALRIGAEAHLVDYLLPQQVAAICARSKITTLLAVPPLWRQLASAPWPQEAKAAMRRWASTGGSMSTGLSGKIHRCFPEAEPILMYGFTEAFRATYLPPDQFDSHPTSLGVPIPHAAVLAVNTDGVPCRLGEEGELLQFGPLVTLGYWERAEDTAKKFGPISADLARAVENNSGPWAVPPEFLGRVARSGDQVRLGTDGQLYFEARLSAFVKSQGFRVSPDEIEGAALETGLVDDAVAFGFEDEGEERLALAVASTREDLVASDLRRALMARLASYQVPVVIDIRSKLPITPSGKHDVVGLREQVSGVVNV